MAFQKGNSFINYSRCTSSRYTCIYPTLAQPLILLLHHLDCSSLDWFGLGCVWIYWLMVHYQDCFVIQDFWIMDLYGTTGILGIIESYHRIFLINFASSLGTRFVADISLVAIDFVLFYLWKQFFHSDINIFTPSNCSLRAVANIGYIIVFVCTSSGSHGNVNIFM